jgi:hypothetical protein
VHSGFLRAWRRSGVAEVVIAYLGGLLQQLPTPREDLRLYITGACVRMHSEFMLRSIISNLPPLTPCMDLQTDKHRRIEDHLRDSGLHAQVCLGF